MWDYWTKWPQIDLVNGKGFMTHTPDVKRINWDRDSLRVKKNSLILFLFLNGYVKP